MCKWMRKVGAFFGNKITKQNYSNHRRDCKFATNMQLYFSHVRVCLTEHFPDRWKAPFHLSFPFDELFLKKKYPSWWELSLQKQFPTEAGLFPHARPKTDKRCFLFSLEKTKTVCRFLQIVSCSPPTLHNWIAITWVSNIVKKEIGLLEVKDWCLSWWLGGKITPLSHSVHYSSAADCSLCSHIFLRFSRCCFGNAVRGISCFLSSRFVCLHAGQCKRQKFLWKHLDINAKEIGTLVSDSAVHSWQI